MEPQIVPDSPDLPLEERKFRDERAARGRELDLRERELATKEKELSRSGWFSPIVIGLYAAALGLIGNVVVARVNTRSSLDVERVRSQSNLVLEATKTANPEEACKNLSFFVRLGLLEDANGTIRNACPTSSPGPPTLPNPGELSRLQNLTGGIGLPPVRVIVHVLDSKGQDVSGLNIYDLPQKLENQWDRAQAFVVPGSPSEMYIPTGTYFFWASKGGPNQPVTPRLLSEVAGAGDVVLNLVLDNDASQKR